MRNRQRSYKEIFPENSECLKDLAKFCRAFDSCWDPDPRIHAALEGRREVWLRIVQHLHLQPTQLLSLYKAKIPEGVPEDG